MPRHHPAPQLCQLKRTITLNVFPNIKPKLAFELNNSCLGGSRWDESRDKISFQNLPLLLRVSIRRQQNDLITGGPFACSPVMWWPNRNSNKPHPFSLSLRVKTVLKHNHIQYYREKLIWMSTEKLGPFSKARQWTATQEVLTPTTLSSRFVKTQYLQSFKQLQFLFPENYQQKLVTSMKEVSQTQPYSTELTSTRKVITAELFKFWFKSLHSIIAFYAN